MAQGEFTKEEAAETEKVLMEMFEALSKSRQEDYLGHLNDILLYISASAKVAREK